MRHPIPILLIIVSLAFFVTGKEVYANGKLVVEYFYLGVPCPDCPPSPFFLLVREVESEYKDEVNFIGWDVFTPAGARQRRQYNLTIDEWIVINFTYPIYAKGITKEELKEAIETFLDACVDVSVSEARTMIDADPLLVILDVRNQSEYDAGHIRRAKLIPVWQLEARIAELDKDRKTLLYCRSGHRSEMACEILANHSFQKVYSMLDGMLAWESAGYPVYRRYSSIQGEINNAVDGDMVFVSSGTYYEHVVVNKTISLMGEDPSTTLIDGNGTQTVVMIVNRHVNVTGFTIQNGANGTSLEVNADFCIIKDCKIINNDRGIFVWSHDNLLNKNTIVNNSDSGIKIYAGCGCSPVLRNVVTENRLSNNYYGIYLRNSGEALIYHNDFINNTYQVFSYGSHTSWDDGYPSGGNHWSDYRGVDEKSGSNQDQPGSDGIGDTPYIIDVLHYQEDQYPLMNPWTSADAASPVTTISLNGVSGDNGWFISDVTVTLSATDDTEVDKTEYSFDNAFWITYTAPFIVHDEGYIKVYYKSTDKAGNPETVKTATIKIDKTAPAGAVTINDGDAYTNSTLVKLALTSTDAASGVRQVRFSNDGIWDAEPWEAPATTKNWTLQSEDGTKTVYVQYVDNAGLVSQSYSATITLDTTSPAILITSPSPGYEIKSSTITVTWNGSDSTSGISHYEIKLSDYSWIDVGTNRTHTFTGLGDGRYTLEIRATDNAGLTKEDSLDFVVNTSPLLGPGYTEEVAIAATTIIAAIGIALYFFKIRKH